MTNPVDTTLEPRSCLCGGEMWFLPFGYDSWVCRRNTRHWYRPHDDRWSGHAEAFANEAD